MRCGSTTTSNRNKPLWAHTKSFARVLRAIMPAPHRSFQACVISCLHAISHIGMPGCVGRWNGFCIAAPCRPTAECSLLRSSESILAASKLKRLVELRCASLTATECGRPSFGTCGLSKLRFESAFFFLCCSLMMLGLGCVSSFVA